MTEPHPGAGSDPAALRTTAVRTDGGWIIDGHKRFTSGAVGAGFCIVMARTPAVDGSPEGATMFLVDMTSPGVRVGEAIHTVDCSMTHRGSAAARSRGSASATATPTSPI
ncbi:acyl-CoA dehydrogenase family protein [Streptomyces sp. TLI_105]|uniref:acyl-CoA dehydrogenase family protein n=1 Tax=Streptomyces sp. TLI_105 TaxID=1881019 RepID=UPI002109DC19|nr:acyl-CoA dehydrogenase family protein [Streptomyces sp. TLI_105]